jgi:hypothetical protein
MRYSLAIANGLIDERADPKWLHKNINYASDIFRASDKEIATSNYTFVILRCPYKRLTSAFLDKAVDLKKPFQIQCKAIDPSINSSQEMFDYASNLTFSKFVESLVSMSHEKLNQHFRPQIDFLVYEDYDKWFSVEDFSLAGSILKKDINLNSYDTREKIGHHISGFRSIIGEYSNVSIRELHEMKCSGVVPDAASLYNEETRQLVGNYFAEDLTLYVEKFGEKGLLF